MENTTTLRLTASYTTEYSRQPEGLPQCYAFTAELPTAEAAREFVAQFPKAAKMYATTLSKADHTVAGWAVARVYLTADRVNDGINESGLRRYKAIVKAAAKLGIEIQYVADCKNSYPTREAFEGAIAR